MPKTAALPIVRLILRLAGQEGRCLVCDTEDHAVEFRVINVHADGSEGYDGMGICPSCAAAHGYHEVLLRGLDNFERHMLGLSVADRGTTGSEVRKEFAHYRRLVVSDKLATPPEISTEHFVAVDKPDPKPVRNAARQGVTRGRHRPLCS